jgi:hypothetical protein
MERPNRDSFVPGQTPGDEFSATAGEPPALGARA